MWYRPVVLRLSFHEKWFLHDVTLDHPPPPSRVTPHPHLPLPKTHVLAPFPLYWTGVMNFERPRSCHVDWSERWEIAPCCRTLEDINKTALCNVNCGCTSKEYTPVCGDNNVTYFSPCHAGCLSTQGRQVSRFSTVTTKPSARQSRVVPLLGIHFVSAVNTPVEQSRVFSLLGIDFVSAVYHICRAVTCVFVTRDRLRVGSLSYLQSSHVCFRY